MALRSLAFQILRSDAAYAEYIHNLGGKTQAVYFGSVSDAYTLLFQDYLRLQPFLLAQATKHRPHNGHRSRGLEATNQSPLLSSTKPREPQSITRRAPLTGHTPFSDIIDITPYGTQRAHNSTIPHICPPYDQRRKSSFFLNCSAKKKEM